jgi:Dockerin type I domain
MIQFRLQHRLIGSVATAAVLLVFASLQAADPPTNASFSSSSDVGALVPPLTLFGTFRQGNPGATLNFNVYNLGTASTISFAHPPTGFGDTSAISLQTANVTGLQTVGGGGTPNAPMQLIVSTSQVSNLLQVSYLLEFSSDSLPNAAHDSLAITAYATVLRHGDYNADGKVDSADYVVWRKTRGQTVTPAYSHADDNGDGRVTDADYNAWRSAFTGTSGSGSSTPGGSALSGPTLVPEPTTAILGLVGAAFVALLARWRKRTAV